MPCEAPAAQFRLHRSAASHLVLFVGIPKASHWKLRFCQTLQLIGQTVNGIPVLPSIEEFLPQFPLLPHKKRIHERALVHSCLPHHSGRSSFPRSLLGLCIQLHVLHSSSFLHQFDQAVNGRLLCLAGFHSVCIRGCLCLLSYTGSAHLRIIRPWVPSTKPFTVDALVKTTQSTLLSSNSCRSSIRHWSHKRFGK